MLTHKPDFIVVGAPKCGTTSLYYYLMQHPDIYLPEKKELHFFSKEILKANFGGPGDADRNLRNICGDESRYNQYFEKASAHCIKGEISPSYFVYPETAERIKEICGAVHIIIMLRDPVEKAFSQYCHMLTNGIETLSFEEALQSEDGRAEEHWNDFWLYTKSSYYCQRVKKFIEVFGKEMVKIIFLEEFSRETNEVLGEICRFLDVNSDYSFKIEERYNKSGKPHSKLFMRLLTRQNPLRKFIGSKFSYGFKQDMYNKLMNLNTGKKPELKEQTRNELKEKFRDDILCLEDFLGLDIGWLKN